MELALRVHRPARSKAMVRLHHVDLPEIQKLSDREEVCQPGVLVDFEYYPRRKRRPPGIVYFDAATFLGNRIARAMAIVATALGPSD
jgi:hypothetical protein